MHQYNVFVKLFFCFSMFANFNYRLYSFNIFNTYAEKRFSGTLNKVYVCMYVCMNARKGSLAFLDEYFQVLNVFHEVSDVFQLTCLHKITQSRSVRFTYGRHLTALCRVGKEKQNKTKQNNMKKTSKQTNKQKTKQNKKQPNKKKEQVQNIKTSSQFDLNKGSCDHYGETRIW